ncbi:MAG: hypothetical protein AAGD07_13410 [Planctomycetota bacterium]
MPNKVGPSGHFVGEAGGVGWKYKEMLRDHWHHGNSGSAKTVLKD